jgi:hypothetical protein
MCFPDPGPLPDAIRTGCRPGGIVSLLVRNGDALAMRPGLLGVWDKAGRAFDGESYLNRIGVSARLEDLTSALASEARCSGWNSGPGRTKASGTTGINGRGSLTP